jgi:hypothetical protein
MKNAMLIGTGALLLLFGISAPAYAQEQHDPQDQPAKPPADKPDAKPTDKPRAEPPKTPEDKSRPDNAAKPPKQTEAKPAQQRPEDAHSNNNNQRAGNQRIPDDKFKAHFGREHTFHVGHPTVVEGRPRFQYGGYSFIIAQPWPTGWGYDDDVYVVDVNGVYYLVDLSHPGVQLELEIVG